MTDKIEVRAEYYPSDNHACVNMDDNPYPDHINAESFTEPDVRRRVYIPEPPTCTMESGRRIKEIADESARLKSENARLRELAGEAVYLIRNESPDCGICRHYHECWTGEAMDYSPGGCIICNKAKELGVEVSA